jgi:hypothetical protein
LIFITPRFLLVAFNGKPTSDLLFLDDYSPEAVKKDRTVHEAQQRVQRRKDADIESPVRDGTD